MGSVRVRRGGEHGNGDSLQWGQVHSGKGRMNMGVMRKDKGEAGGGRVEEGRGPGSFLEGHAGHWHVTWPHGERRDTYAHGCPPPTMTMVPRATWHGHLSLGHVHTNSLVSLFQVPTPVMTPSIPSFAN